MLLRPKTGQGHPPCDPIRERVRTTKRYRCHQKTGERSREKRSPHEPCRTCVGTCLHRTSLSRRAAIRCPSVQSTTQTLAWVGEPCAPPRIRPHPSPDRSPTPPRLKCGSRVTRGVCLFPTHRWKHPTQGCGAPFPGALRRQSTSASVYILELRGSFHCEVSRLLLPSSAASPSWLLPFVRVASATRNTRSGCGDCGTVQLLCSPLHDRHSCLACLPDSLRCFDSTRRLPCGGVR